jgi:hypothetical protein
MRANLNKNLLQNLMNTNQNLHKKLLKEVLDKKFNNCRIICMMILYERQEVNKEGKIL